MNPKNVSTLAALGAVIALGIGGVELAVGEKAVATVLIRTADGRYEYRERIVTQKGEVPSDSDAAKPGEAVVEVVTATKCAGGNELKCLANADTAQVSPCVRARGPDCFRQAPGQSKPRFFGLKNTFLATEATGTQCEPTTCMILLGDPQP